MTRSLSETHLPVHVLRREFLDELDDQLRRLTQTIAVPLAVPNWNGPAWWRVDEDGNVLLKLRFKGHVLAVNGEATTALLGSLEEAFIVLEGVRRAALRGELDRQLCEVIR
jgi:hypothetical protein